MINQKIRAGGYSCFLAMALCVPQAARAANFTIDDTLANETIVVTGTQFDRGSGFVGAGTFAETPSGVTFSGQWLANATSTGTATILWLEPGNIEAW